VIHIRLLARALWWRRGASLAIAAVVVLTLTIATLGPLYVHSASESVLRDTLTTTPVPQTFLRTTSHTSPSTAVLKRLTGDADASALPYRAKTLQSLRIAGVVHVSDRLGDAFNLTWRTDECAHLQLASGRCPRRAGEVLVQREAARRISAKTGDVLTTSIQGLSSPLRVVGTYLTPPATPYWAGHDDDFIVSISNSEATLDQLQAFYTVPATFDELDPHQALGFAEDIRLLDPHAVRFTDVPTLRRTTERAADRLTRDGYIVDNELGPVLDQAVVQRTSITHAAIALVGLVVLLCLIVLLAVLTTAARQRSPEVAAARLRGVRPWPTATLALREPLLLCAIGAPVGVIAGIGAAHLLARIRLLPGTPVTMTWTTWLVIAAAVVVVLGCATASGVRLLRRPTLSLWERTEPPAVNLTARAAGVRRLAEVAVVAVVTVVVTMFLRRHGATWTLLLPVPLALAAAVIVVRLLPLATAPLLRRTRGSHRVAFFLALRHLVRRRDAARTAALLVVAFALATTAIAGWSLTRRNIDSRAAGEVGAPTVLQVQPDATHPNLNLQTAVRKADPAGHTAMAVLDHSPFENDIGGRMIAVDASRLSSVLGTRLPGTSLSSADVQAALRTRPDAAVTTFGTPSQDEVVTGVDGQPLKLRVAATSATLPRAGDAGSVVDLAYAARGRGPVDIIAQQEVWLTKGSHPAVVKALQDQGLQIVSADTTRTHRNLLTRQGPALISLLAVATAAAAVLLAVATTICLVHLGARRRSYELASLRLLGLSPSRLRRACSLELLLAVLIGVVLGVAAGTIAARLALPSMPLYADGVSTWPQIRDLTPLPLLEVAGTAILAGWTAAAISGALLVRSARPSRLREAQA
jgi:predicted lysophospholipase L1 biosynthesis ABC-type transport system permease subunit